MSENPSGYSWDEYRVHVIHELERMSDVLEKITDRLGKMENDQSEAHGRARLLGGAAGLATAALLEAARAFFGWISRPH